MTDAPRQGGPAPVAPAAGPVEVALGEEHLDNLFGPQDENLRRIEQAFGVEIAARGGQLRITSAAATPPGESRPQIAGALLVQLDRLQQQGYRVRASDVVTAIRVFEDDPKARLEEFFRPTGVLAALKRHVTPRNLRQQLYLKAMADHDLVITIGPAGTGKTYLAVAMAAAMLNEQQVRRIVLARPAVEAGEKLGFLPGDLVEKVNPYLRPLYDSLYDILGFERVGKMMERSIIEVAPLAFMRGRTLNESFIILDEAQNATSEQMKMLLTRIGFGSKAVINGDVTQVDLPHGRASGLREAQEVLAGVEGIAFMKFDKRDVVRHPLVQKVVHAYEKFEDRKARREEP